MLCPNCESKNRDEAKFCDQCGFPLVDRASFQSSEEDVSVGDTPSEDAPVVDVPSEDVFSDNALIEEEPVVVAPLEDEGFELNDEKERIFVSGEELEEEQAANIGETQLLETVQEDDLTDDATKVIEYDFAGFDKHSDEFEERIVSPDYKMPVPETHDGGTMQMPRIDGEGPQKSKDYLASSTKKRKGNGKKVLTTILIVAIVAAAIALITNLAGLWGGKTVSDVVGMTEADAKSVLMDQGFDVRVEKVKSDDTEGLVLIMDPQAHSRIEEGSEVVIHVATARTIPNVKGKSKDEALKILAEEGYENVKTVKESSDKKEGTVIAVNPKVGSSAISSTEIKLTLAQPYTVPEIAGLEFNDAVKKIEKAGLQYEVVYISTDSYPEGSIIGTEPVAGSVVSKGAYIVIQIAQAWGSQLEEIVQGYLAPGSAVEIDGTSYTIVSLDSVAYIGNNTVSYTASARPYTYFFGELLSTSNPQTISGTVVFDDDGDIVSVS